jgi:multiple sugar transport system ATP-binding protein
VVVGLRPEHFDDASVISDRSDGHTFKTRIDVLESMGSEFYAYFMVDSEGVSSSELDELAQDAGSADLPQAQDGIQVVARLDAASHARQGQEADLWFDARKIHLFDPECGRSLFSTDGPAQPAAPNQSLPASSAG